MNKMSKRITAMILTALLSLGSVGSAFAESSELTLTASASETDESIPVETDDTPESSKSDKSAKEASGDSEYTGTKKETLSNGIVMTFNYDTGKLTYEGSGALEDSGFSYYEKDYVKNVIISEGITSLPVQCFDGCSNLESAKLPNSLENISWGCFWNCSSLKSITIPNSVTEIEAYAFYSTGLTEVTIPGSVKTIGENAFNYCTSLSSVTFNEGLEKIGAYCFGTTKISKVTFPSTLKNISYDAFRSTPFKEELDKKVYNGFIISDDNILWEYVGEEEEVDIPDNVRMIAGGTFWSADTVKTVRLNNTVDFIPEKFCVYCDNLKKVILNDKITEIADEAFEDCEYLTDINIPNSLKRIGLKAFNDCTSLAKVSVPDTIEWIEPYAFTNTAFINDYPDDFVTFGNLLYLYKGSDSEVTIPENIEKILPTAFSYNLNITTVIFNSNLKTIEDEAFSDCPYLEQAYIPESVQKIGRYALGYHLEDDYIPNSSFEIYGKAGSEAERYAKDNNFTFYSSTTISGNCGNNAGWTLDILSGELRISGSGKIYDYDTSESEYKQYSSKIKSITIEEGITAVGKYAFYDFDKVTKVTLPDSLTTINTYAFVNTAITEIELPGNLDYVSSSAFEKASDSKNYIWDDDNFTWKLGYSDLKTVLQKITVREGSGKYYSDNGILYNKDGELLVAVPSKLKAKTITIPDNIKYIDPNAFSQLKNVNTIVFHKNFKFSTDNPFEKLSRYSKDGFNFVIYGSAPDTSVLDENAFDNLTIYCDFSKSGWSEARNYFENSSKNVTFVDISNMNSKLKLTAEKTNLSVGEAVQIETGLGEIYKDNFTLTSSDTNTAAVSESGVVLASGRGTAVITAKSKDGTQSDTITITVSDDYKLESGKTIELDEKIFGNISRHEDNLFFSEKYKGYFILNNNKLSFYSIVNDSYYTIEEFENVVCSGVNGNILTVGSGNSLISYNLDTLERTAEIDLGNFTPVASAADSSGRIFISQENKSKSKQYKLSVYSPEGKLICTSNTDTLINDFYDFNTSNGDFYYSTEYSTGGHFYLLMGFSDGEILRVANFNGSSISFIEKTCNWQVGMFGFQLEGIELLSKYEDGAAADGVELIDNRYLVISNNALSQIEIKDLSVSDTDNILAYSSYDSDFWGTRTVYNKSRESVTMYRTDNKLIEYDLSDGSRMASFNTQHKVYNLAGSGDYVIAVEEEDGKYYLETVDWKYPDSVSISGERNTMRAGESQQLALTTNSALTVECGHWSSSNDRIATVTEDGNVSAWQEGDVTITYQIGNASAQYSITVLPKDTLSDSFKTINNGVTITDNESANNYTVWSKVIKSYLYENGNGYTRVEAIGGYYDDNHYLIVENYDDNFDLKDSKKIDNELPLFGGFFSGSKYNFIVYGKENPVEDYTNEDDFDSSYNDSQEVLRIVKYTKNWERISSRSLYGKNTAIPFDAGSLRMDESDGTLYIYTCHEMYNGHQASMAYWVDEETLEIKDEQYELANIAYGYVSHSFNQFIKVDNGSVYRVDHGDAYPRGIFLTKSDADKTRINNYAYVLGINSLKDSYNNNPTGVSIGGFEISDNKLITVGNSVDQSSEDTYSPYGQRNIFVSSIDKDDFEKSNIVWLTNYTEAQNITPNTPHITDLGNGHYIVMWEETNDVTYKTVLKCADVDEGGNVSGIKTYSNARLSDCKPILDKNGRVVWYATDGEKLNFYGIDPYSDGGEEDDDVVTGKMYGDVDGDGKITSGDSLSILRASVELEDFDNELTELADVDEDGDITSADALEVLRYSVSLPSKSKTGEYK